MGSDLRLAVTADSGINVEESKMGVTYGTVDIDATIFELWKLEEGAAPVLLERSDAPLQGLQTHAEHPVQMGAVYSTEMFGDGNGYMGELDHPNQ